jgi:MYXO-CTERM domain-containing protein
LCQAVPRRALNSLCFGAVRILHSWAGVNHCQPTVFARALIAIVGCFVCLAVPLQPTAAQSTIPVPPVAGTFATTPSAGIPAAAVVAPAPTANLLNGGQAIPGNGSLVFEITNGVIGTIGLSDPKGQVVEGTVRMIGRYAIWTPTRVLDPGTYTLQLSSAAGGTVRTQAVTIGATWTLAKPAISASPTAARVDTPGDQVCCSGLKGFPLVPGGCFSAMTYSTVNFTPNFMSSADQSALGQFLFRVQPAGTGATPDYQPWFRLQGPVSFGTQASQYCIDVTAIDVTSGHTYDYADLMTRCVADNGMIGDLSPKPASIDAPRVLDHSVCQVPPLGYETRWCDVNRTVCSASPAAIGCEDFGHICNGEPEPTPPVVAPSAGRAAAGAPVLSAGTGANVVSVPLGGNGANPGNPPFAGGASDPAAGSGAATAPSGAASHHVSSCAVSPRPSASHAAWPWLGVLGLLVVRRKRARSR